MDLLSPEMDDKIRARLKLIDSAGRLGVAAAVIGIAGGETELRKIMNSTGELHLMDRGCIGIALF